MKWIDRPENSIPYYTFENISKAGFSVNAFTSRIFRKNGETKDSLQLVMMNDSDPAEVEYCERAMMDQFGIDPSRLVFAAQEHTVNIHVVVPEDLAPENIRPKLEGIDGLVTDIPHVMLKTFGADCPSVFLADPVHKAIGLCHSGRNGTQRHISAKMLKVMQEKFGTQPAQVLAAVSPGICVECYEVGDDVAEDFIMDYLDLSGASAMTGLERGLSEGLLQFIDGRYHIDLPLSIRLSLTAAGVPEENIEESHMCTKCRKDIFFSLRGEGRILNENCALFMV